MNRILLMADGPGSAGATAAPRKTAAQLQAELDAANAKITQLTAAQVQNEADEKLIVEKMTVGVTRAQAIAAIKRQRDFDNSAYGKMVKARHEQRQAEAQKSKK